MKKSFSRYFSSLPKESIPLFLLIGGALTFGIYSMTNKAATSNDIYIRKDKNPYLPSNIRGMENKS